MSARLTTAQKALLLDVARRPQHVVASYKPARKLGALELVKLTDISFGLWVEITDAGRAALAKATGGAA